MSDTTPEALAVDHLRLFAAGDEAGMIANVSSDYFNHRSADEPLAARGRGPAAIIATLHWIHRAFTDMQFDVRQVIVRDSLVAVDVTLHARQHGPFVIHDSPDGHVTDVFPSRGRSFRARQTHWIEVADRRVCAHDAVRDDLSMAKQLGWLPPTPIYIVRMLLARASERDGIRP